MPAGYRPLMDWERTQRRLEEAERLVKKVEGYLAKAQRAIREARYSNGYTINAERALKDLERLLEEGIEKRDRLKDELRRLTH
jgi:predicted  nucleic acid-binding Zn-ribbon protein